MAVFTVTDPSVTFNGTDTADVIIGSAGDDNIYGRGGNDTLEGGAGNDNLRGGEGSDRLFGGEGNDQLDGGEGADYMVGGEGNDTYIVNDESDVVIEKAGEAGGRDTVKSFIDYTLRDNVENLYLVGDADINGTGNALDNGMKGNSGDNSLRGYAGNDSINGGAGNDVINGGIGDDFIDGGADSDIATYFDATSGVTVNLGIDTRSQNTGGAGRDTLKNIENLEGSQFNDVLTGNSQDNKIRGLGGDDVLRGAGGNDNLTGGTGADQFRFDSVATNGVDTLRSFVHGVDTIAFSISDGYIADKSLFSYGADNKQVFYDADGAGGADAVLLANLADGVVDGGDIVFIA